jgi:hypothetical protein
MRWCLKRDDGVPEEAIMPCWRPREDKAARLARGWCEGRESNWGPTAKQELADFLRRNGVEGV